MQITPFVKIVHDKQPEIKKFDFEITHLIATVLNNGLIEVFVRWSAAPRYLVGTRVANEGITAHKHEPFNQDERSATPALSGNAMLFTSMIELYFSDVTYEIQDGSNEVASAHLSMVVALEQPNDAVTYTPLFIRNHNWGCSVYFALNTWQETDNDPFVDLVFEQ